MPLTSTLWYGTVWRAARALAACTAVLWAAFAQAQSGNSNSLEALQRLLKANSSGQSSFTQTVTGPSKADGTKARQTVSRGTFAFARPGRFRFDYTTPFPQVLVADGTTLWMYDPDLAQATATDQAAALGSTPAALITSTADLADLRVHYVLESLPSDQGLQWVRATPKQSDGALKWIELGFDAQHVAALVMLDQFGQTSDMRFSALAPLGDTAVKVFSFKPPAGADVIRQ
jgi:outer membrane lipoprotein carrier protein